MADENELYQTLLSKAQGIGPPNPMDRQIPPEVGTPGWNPIIDMLQRTGMNDPIGSGSVGLGAGVPVGGDSSLIETLLRFKKEPLAEAKALLYRTLNNFRAPEATVSNVVPETVMTRRPPPLQAREVLARAQRRIPEAKGLVAYPKDMALKRPPLAHSQYNMESSFRTRSKPVLDLEKQLQMEIYNRPAVRSGDAISDLMSSNEARIPASAPKPALSGRWGRGGKNKR